MWEDTTDVEKGITLCVDQRMKKEYIIVPIRFTPKQYRNLKMESLNDFRHISEIIREMADARYEQVTHKRKNNETI